MNREEIFKSFIKISEIPSTDNELKDEVRILLTQEEALIFYKVLCALPYRAATLYDNEPPMEREKPIESIIKQLQTQVHWDDCYEYQFLDLVHKIETLESTLKHVVNSGTVNVDSRLNNLESSIQSIINNGAMSHKGRIDKLELVFADELQRNSDQE